jgi:hypothetical protein
MALEKAYLTNLETGDRIDCLFNPTEYSFSKTNQWQVEPVMGDDVPPPKFLSGAPMTLTMSLFFDTYEAGTDVRKHTEKLLKLMQVDPNLRNERNQKGRPPRCMFSWGRVWGFKAIITQMSQRFTLFLEDGTPVRATVSVTFQQVEQEGTYPAQNPTSQGRPGQRTRIVRPGDRLDWLAFEEYRDSSLWRLIAEANDLDDPQAIKPGQRLVIAPRG